MAGFSCEVHREQALAEAKRCGESIGQWMVRVGSEADESTEVYWPTSGGMPCCIFALLLRAPEDEWSEQGDEEAASAPQDALKIC